MARKTTSTTAAGPNKAQAEFEKYTQRRRKQAAAGALASESASTTRPEVAASSPFPGGGLSWAVPLGVGMAPVYLGGPPPGPGGPGAGGAGSLGEAVGGLTAGIGTTVRLGVDLLNAALFNSVKILGGFTGAYGYGHHEDCGCGYACESCCEPSCCEPDCCGCECCSPGVGSCC
jgi:hypothetical protein